MGFGLVIMKTIKTIAYVFGYGVGISSICITLIAVVSILMNGYAYFIEPNLIIVFIEFFLLIFGLIILSFIAIKRCE